MAQKITLSIPDMLHEKLTRWRSSFNFSKMFQEALTEAIQKKEELQKRFSDDFDMPDIVKRLRHEKKKWEDSHYKTGKEHGIRWARNAHYEDLLYVLYIEDTYSITSDDNYKTYFEELYEANDLGRYAAVGGADHEQRFIDGWFEGVNSFWNEVKEQI